VSSRSTGPDDRGSGYDPPVRHLRRRVEKIKNRASGLRAATKRPIFDNLFYADGSSPQTCTAPPAGPGRLDLGHLEDDFEVALARLAERVETGKWRASPAKPSIRLTQCALPRSLVVHAAERERRLDRLSRLRR
jgi:hypothetical protein